MRAAGTPWERCWPGCSITLQRVTLVVLAPQGVGQQDTPGLPAMEEHPLPERMTVALAWAPRWAIAQDLPQDHLPLWWASLLLSLLSSAGAQQFWATPVSSWFLAEELPGVSFRTHLCLSPPACASCPALLWPPSFVQALSSRQFLFPVAHDCLWYLASPLSPTATLYLPLCLCGRSVQTCRTSAEQMFWDVLYQRA